jgi:hypothetical protein
MADRGYEIMSSGDVLRFQLNSLVIRNSPIAREYPGRLNAFRKEFLPDKFKKVIDELIACGLKHKEDFLFVDAGLYLMSGNSGPFILGGVIWQR